MRLGNHFIRLQHNRVWLWKKKKNNNYTANDIYYYVIIFLLLRVEFLNKMLPVRIEQVVGSSGTNDGNVQHVENKRRTKTIAQEMQELKT